MNTSRYRLLDYCLASDAELDRLTATLTPEEADELLQDSKRERLYPRVYSALRDRCPLSEERHQHFRNIQTMRREMRETLYTCADVLQNVQYMVMKGISVERYYPDGFQRYFGDLDLCAQQAEDYWQLVNALLASGYALTETLSFQQEPDTQQLSGAVRVQPDTEGHKLNGVELHLGAFLMTSRTYLPIDVFTRRIVPMQFEGVSVPAPDREGTLLLFLGELVSRDIPFLRDLFDAVYLLNNAEGEIDLDYVAEQVHAYHLYFALNYLRREFETTAPLLGMPPLLAELIERVQLDSHYRGRSITREHLWPYLRRHTSQPLKHLVLAKLREATYRWNQQDRLLPLMKHTDLRWGVMPFFANGNYVFFIRLDDFRSPQWQWIMIGRYEFALTPIGTLIAACHMLYSDEELDEATERLQEYHQRQGVPAHA